MKTIEQALSAVTPSLRDVAEWVDAPYGTVRAWRLGTRNPSPEQVARLARALRRQSALLIKTAEKLEVR